MLTFGPEISSELGAYFLSLNAKFYPLSFWKKKFISPYFKGGLDFNLQKHKDSLFFGKDIPAHSVSDFFLELGFGTRIDISKLLFNLEGIGLTAEVNWKWAPNVYDQFISAKAGLYIAIPPQKCNRDDVIKIELPSDETVLPTKFTRDTIVTMDTVELGSLPETEKIYVDTIYQEPSIVEKSDGSTIIQPNRKIIYNRIITHTICKPTSGDWGGTADNQQIQQLKDTIEKWTKNYKAIERKNLLLYKFLNTDDGIYEKYRQYENKQKNTDTSHTGVVPNEINKFILNNIYTIPKLNILFSGFLLAQNQAYPGAVIPPTTEPTVESELEDCSQFLGDECVHCRDSVLRKWMKPVTTIQEQVTTTQPVNNTNKPVPDVCNGGYTFSRIFFNEGKYEVNDMVNQNEATSIYTYRFMLDANNDIFEVDTDRYTDMAFSIMDTIANILANCPNLALIVQGHHSSTGSVAQNKKLAYRRAAEVCNYIADLLDANGASKIAVPITNGRNAKEFKIHRVMPIDSASIELPYNSKYNRCVVFKLIHAKDIEDFYKRNKRSSNSNDPDILFYGYPTKFNEFYHREIKKKLDNEAAVNSRNKWLEKSGKIPITNIFHY
jgi:outer membrane protein OmpA-like peptidoglycan-associated protein